MIKLTYQFLAEEPSCVRCFKAGCIALFLVAASTAAWSQQVPSPAQPDIEQRIDTILAKMTLEQKVAYLRGASDGPTGIPNPGSSEALHGVVAKPIGIGPSQEAIPATSFGQVNGMGYTWDPKLIQHAGAVMGYEARYITQSKKYNRPSLGLWAPNADLARDPRWGRDEESYGEDPYLTGTMSAAYARGIQGDDPKYWLAASLVKHFFANSNETTRGSSSSNFDERLMREYYSVPFRMAFLQGGVHSFMASYNAWNGVPMTVNPVLQSLLKAQWHADGIISSDFTAIENVFALHKYLPTMEDAFSASVKNGINQFLVMDQKDYITLALKDGTLKESDIDSALRGRLRTTLYLGLMDPPSQVRYSTIGSEGEPEPWTTDAHKQIARQVVEESIVLLKNESNFLPLDSKTIKSIAVIGPNADKVLSGTPYDPVMPYAISPLDGIRRLGGPSTAVTFTADNKDGAAVRAAQLADVAVVVVGNDPFCGATNIGAAFNQDTSTKPCSDPGEGREGRDRLTLDLSQEELVKAVYAANPKTVLVLISGFPYAITWSQQHVPAILHLAHASQEQGTGLAEVLFGQYDPAGRITQTWPASTSQLPPMTDYDIRHGRTYLYMKEKPLYAFGHGLSYTSFKYSNLIAKEAATSDDVTVTAHLTNIGTRQGDEVVQIYVAHQGSKVLRPLQELRGFQRISLQPHETRTVSLKLPIESLGYWDEARHSFNVESDRIEIRVGAASDDIRLKTAIAVHPR